MQAASLHDLSKLTNFLKRKLEPSVLARLEVGFNDVEFSQHALGADGAEDSSGTLRPIPQEKFRPPRELCVIPAGLNRSRLKGDYLFDETSAEFVRELSQDWGNLYSSDYEHAAFHPNNIPAPASSWYKVEVRDSGLWAVDIQWLEEAAERLRKREYRYWSPAFLRDNATGRVLVYFNFALTNIPATHRMKTLLDSVLAELSVSARARLAPTPVAASSAGPSPVVDAASSAPPLPPKEPTMEWLLALLNLTPSGNAETDKNNVTAAIQRARDFRTATLSALRLAPTATQDDVVESLRSMDGTREAVLAGLQLHGSAGAEQVKKALTELHTGAQALDANVKRLSDMEARLLSATGTNKAEELEAAVGEMRKLRTGVATLTGKSSVDEQLIVLEANKDAAAQVSTLSSQVETLSQEKAALEKTLAEQEVARLIDEATTAGKLTPALREKAMAMASKTGLEGLKLYLESLPTAPAGRPPASPPESSPTGATVTLSSAQRERAKKLGVSEADMLKAIQEQEAEERKLAQLSAGQFRSV